SAVGEGGGRSGCAAGRLLYAGPGPRHGAGPARRGGSGLLRWAPHVERERAAVMAPTAFRRECLRSAGGGEPDSTDRPPCRPLNPTTRCRILTPCASRPGPSTG